MSIKIIRQEDTNLTSAEYHRLRHEYEMAHQFYSGPVPTFEDWVRSRHTPKDEAPLSTQQALRQVLDQMHALSPTELRTELDGHRNGPLATALGEAAEFVASLLASAAPATPSEPHIVRLHAWGGVSRHHDYEMSDGTIRTLKDTEANALRGDS